MADRRLALAALALALTWGLLPLLPAVWAGGIPGSPFTDLYPSVWGLGWFVTHAGEGLPTFAPELSAPAGMPFYFSSPLHGWLAVLTAPLLGTAGAYTLGIALARVATVWLAWWAGRGLGLDGPGALVLAASYGAAPFFHGYAVEGIIEGTDGWTLMLWVGAAARRRWGLAVLGAFTVVASSWYLAMVGVLLASGVALWRWRASASFGVGLLLALPLLLAFTGAFSGGAPLPDEIRAAMGTQLTLASPGVLEPLNPFAMTSWLGVLLPVLAAVSARRHPWLAVGAACFWLASLGQGPLYDLPVWRSVRFPYRLHAGTLLLLGVLAGHTVDGWSRRWRLAVLLGPLLALEGLLLSPIEPVVPTAPVGAPAAYRAVPRDAVLLAMPGPLALPPGTPNPSRPRARYLLYGLGEAGLRSPWAFDFNSVGTAATEHPVLTAARSWDRKADLPRRPLEVDQLRDASIDFVALHERDLGQRATDQLRRSLVEQGCTVLVEEDGVTVITVTGSL